MLHGVTLVKLRRGQSVVYIRNAENFREHGGLAVVFLCLEPVEIMKRLSQIGQLQKSERLDRCAFEIGSERRALLR